MPSVVHLVIIMVTISTLSCGSMSYTRTGVTLPARELNCDFQIVTAMPDGPFKELGTVDIQPGMAGKNVFTNLAHFKNKIAPDVCSAGGDVAVAQANGYGMYMKAIVLAVSSGDRPAPSVNATAGCQFDLQCKGERICVAGVCAEPNKN